MSASPDLQSTNGGNDIAPVATISNDLKSDTVKAKEKGVSVDEKALWNVEIRESIATPLESWRQRYRRLSREIFNKEFLLQTGEVLWKFGKFTGPGAIISVAYIDPDNYQTAVSSGAEFKFKLLFAILFSNIVAVYLQVSYAERLAASTNTL